MQVLWTIGRVLIGCALLVAAAYWRTPILASIRYPLFAGIIVMAMIVMAFDIRMVLRGTGRLRGIAALSLVLAAGALLWSLGAEAQFRWIRYQVLNADPKELETVGRHLVVGYRDAGSLRALLERRAIGGVFVTRINVEGRTADDVAAQIAGWQSLRRSQGLPPLWIASDQEGGPVSRLSPPLPRQPAIGSVVASATAAQRDEAVRVYAETQARALHDIGVNLNLAPVVDINHGLVNAGDRYTQIYRRAISNDPAIVADTASQYCATLKAHGVRCVLKHFPGLGRVTTDTHIEDARLDAPVSALADTDWLPFRTVLNNGADVVMLGHVRMMALDAVRPASMSPAVINVLRHDWQFNGLLITDDATMGAFYGSPSGLTGGAIEALNAGVDLILISYDTDQVYPAIAALLAAVRQGNVPAATLARSRQRLDRLGAAP